ncbi:hypothetical protein CRG98_013398 [Punica granatum]|uniref:Uncharacterized protein n=1 Tax=Punica granatum TaxID=22663 RepID=A0A2I0KDC4_PUNGR|nr:hypothetical protein CRG98_013398 [Punica granatum]
MNHLKGQKKFMTIKGDLEKAYDRLSWSSVHKTLLLADRDNILKVQAFKEVSKLGSGVCISSPGFKLAGIVETNMGIYLDVARSIESAVIFMACCPRSVTYERIQSSLLFGSFRFLSSLQAIREDNTPSPSRLPFNPRDLDQAGPNGSVSPLLICSIKISFQVRILPTGHYVPG